MTVYSKQTTEAWTALPVNLTSRELSHTRAVYINTESRLVVKLETSFIRTNKRVRTFQLADEIAYKISKLFHWNTAPKTKVFHQFSQLDTNKVKYIQLREVLLKIAGEHHPITFTFQILVDGRTIPNQGDPKTETPDLASYQRAFLFGILIGKSDARGF